MPKNFYVGQLKVRRPSLVFQPNTHSQFKAGADQIINAIRPTLGPLPRIVAIEHVGGRSKPAELLDDGAIIARRIIQLSKRGEDMGAMFVRHMLWKMYDKVGDGTATAAIIFQSLFNQGVRYVQEGGNAMLLRGQLEALIAILTTHIESQSIYLTGKEKLGALANSVCHDLDLAAMFGEIFDLIGEYGRLELRSAAGHRLERTYTEGSYWDGGLLSRTMLTGLKNKRISFENAAILVTDLEIIGARQLVPVLHSALVAGFTHLVIVAKTISTAAIGMLQLEENLARIHAVVVKTPGLDIFAQRDAIEDLAILTGARPILGVAGGTLESVTSQHLGTAKRVWADPDMFGIVSGRGDVRALRNHIGLLRKGFTSASAPEDRTRLRDRVGKLMGGTATLYIGDRSPIDLAVRMELAERTVRAMRGAIRDGVVPGGGVALLGCRGILRAKMVSATKDEERAACQMLLRAVEMPTRELMQNAGFEPNEWMLEINKAEPNHGLDTVGGKIVDMNAAGIYDSASTVKHALSYGTFSAALALTVDVLVHRTRPPESSTTG